MNLSVEAVEERMKGVLLEWCSQALDGADIRSDVPLVKEGLALDSVALLEFVLGLEDEFDLILDDRDLTVERFESLRTLAGFVHEKLLSEGRV